MSTKKSHRYTTPSDSAWAKLEKIDAMCEGLTAEQVKSLLLVLTPQVVAHIGLDCDITKHQAMHDLRLYKNKDPLWIRANLVLNMSATMPSRVGYLASYARLVGFDLDLIIKAID